jgi:hypothetical protein
MLLLLLWLLINLTLLYFRLLLWPADAGQASTVAPLKV